MNDNQNIGKRPLRQIFNKAKDLNNTYLKNDDVRNQFHGENEVDISEEDLEHKIHEKLKDAGMITESEEIKEEEVVGIEEFNPDNNLIKLEEENSNLKDQLVRKVAEFENFKRRTEKEKLDLISYANERLLIKLLEVPDDMEKAIEMANKSEDNKSLLEGFEMINKKLLKLLEDSGVKKIEIAKGAEFDVNLHEALLQTPSNEVSEGCILQVVQNGYTIGDKVLRHAKVITSAGN